MADTSRREKILSRRVRAQSIRLKELQLAEKRSLDLKLARLASSRQKQNRAIDRDIRLVRAEFLSNSRTNDGEQCESSGEDEFLSVLDTQSEIPRHTTSALSWTEPKRATSAPPTASCDLGRTLRVGSASQTKSWRENCDDSKSKPTNCQFDRNNATCQHFPCSKPQSYTHIGIKINTDKKPSNVVVVVLATYATQTSINAEDLDIKSVRRAKKSCTDQCLMKERALKKLITDMKYKSSVSRPKDWCTNYGQRTSRRKILKAALPTSMADF